MLDKIGYLWYTIDVMGKDIPPSKMLGGYENGKASKRFSRLERNPVF
nr:MAG TPA: hypothetical protein [Caudoviricetes sp.]